MILEVIIKYWLEVLLGLIASGLGIACKKIYNLYKKEQNYQRSKEQQEFYEDLKKLIKEGNEQSRQGDTVLQEQINIVKDGVLSLQKKDFKQDCRELLTPGHQITLAEFEALQEEHNTYKSLGGNHDGDMLFDMVAKKAANDLTE